MLKVRRTSTFAVFLVSLAASLNTSFAQTEKASLSSIPQDRKIRVAMSSQPPYMMISPDGKVGGIVLDLENEVLSRLGLQEIDPEVTAWSAMIPALQAHRVDFVADLAPTIERCKAVLFSAPIYAYRIALYVPTGNPKHLSGVDRLVKDPNIKIAMIQSSAPGAYAMKMGVGPSKVIAVPDVQAGVATVVGGRADVYLESNTAVSEPKKLGLEMIVDNQAPIFGASVAFRKEDVAFRNAFNRKRSDLIKAKLIERLYQKYGMTGGQEQADTLAKLSSASAIIPSCE